MGKRELVALLCLSSWCLVIIDDATGLLLQFVVVVFPDHTYLLFSKTEPQYNYGSIAYICPFQICMRILSSP